MLSPRSLRVSRCCLQFIPLAAWRHGTLAEHTLSKSDGNRARSTSVPRLAAYGCACSVQKAGLRRSVLTQIRRVVQGQGAVLQTSQRARFGLPHLTSTRLVRLVDVVDPGTCPWIEAVTAPVQDHRARVPRPASCSHCEKHLLDRCGWTACGTSPSLDRAQQCPHTAAGSACPSAAEHPRA